MDINKCYNNAVKLHDDAIRECVLKFKDKHYYLRFNRLHSMYKVTDSAGNFLINFNTRKISQAKKWLKEYLEN